MEKGREVSPCRGVRGCETRTGRSPWTEGLLGDAWGVSLTTLGMSVALSICLPSCWHALSSAGLPQTSDGLEGQPQPLRGQLGLHSALQVLGHVPGSAADREGAPQDQPLFVEVGPQTDKGLMLGQLLV